MAAQSSVLLVEGNNDSHVIMALCEHHKLPENFKIIPCKGADDVLNNMRIRLTTPEQHHKIGIVLDADENVQGRLDSFLWLITQCGKYDCTNIELSSKGFILQPIDNIYPTVGLWIMPNNSTGGMLEDFVVSLAHKDDEALMTKADEILDQLEEEGIQKYKSVHRIKAKIHTFLAWQDEPGKPMGQAITARILNADAENAKLFIQWLKKLFG